MRPRERLRVFFVRYGVLDTEFRVQSTLRQMFALAERGHDVTVVAMTTARARKSSCCTTSRVTLHTVMVRAERPLLAMCQFVLAAFFRLAFIAGQTDCVILDPTLAPFLFPITLLSRLTTRSPILILKVPSNPVETGGPIATFRWSLAICLAGLFFDRILFISPMLRDYYCHMLRLPPHKAGIWPSSVDLSVFDPKLCSEQEISEVRRKLDLDGKVAVIYHGAISRGRGIMEAVKAMGLLKQVGTNVKLVLLGYGPFRQEIRRYVEVEGLEDVVTVPDPVQIKGVAKYLAASDVEIIPMPDHVWWRYQCFIKVLECLAMNKPLISTDLPAVRAVVDEVPVVQWMTGSTALHIADALQGYIKTRGLLRPSLGRAIASKYSVETIAKNVEAYIEACRHRR